MTKTSKWEGVADIVNYILIGVVIGLSILLVAINVIAANINSGRAVQMAEAHEKRLKALEAKVDSPSLDFTFSPVGGER